MVKSTNKKKISEKRLKQIRSALKSGGSLDIPSELKERGFHYRWVSSENPGRIQNIKKLGYVPVMDKDSKEYSIYGGATKNGKEYRLHLMKIEAELKQEIDLVKAQDRRAERTANMNSAFDGLNKNEIFTKQGEGDISSLSDIKKL